MLLIHSSQSKISGARRGSRVCTASRLMILPPFPRARAALRCGGCLPRIWILAALFFILFSLLRQCQTAVGRKASIGALTSLHRSLASLNGVGICNILPNVLGLLRGDRPERANLQALCLPYHKWRSDQSNLK